MATLTQPATALLLAILLLGASCASLFPRATSPKDKAKAKASYKRGLANKHLGKKAEAEADMKKGRELGFQD